MDEGEHILTNKGLPIWVRPMHPDDAHHLVRIFEHMGVESRYYRFNISLIDPDPAFVTQTAAELANIDPSTGEAFLAFAEVEHEGLAPIGGVRYVRATPTEAEISVAVRDDFQLKGVGTALLMQALHAAREAGIETITATVHLENHSVRSLLRKVPWPVHWDHDSGPYASVRIDLSRWPDEEAQHIGNHPPDDPRAG